MEYLELASTATSHDSVEGLREVGGCTTGVWVLPESTRARPRLLRTAWFYSGYKFLPRSRRLFDTFSTGRWRMRGPHLETWTFHAPPASGTHLFGLSRAGKLKFLGADSRISTSLCI